MLRNESTPVDTIDGVEFIDLTPTDISPLVSECSIKVLYVGRNRNGSFIDKPTAINMAKTLRSCPIVGVWREDIEDFGDHGNVITIENDEVKFACKTVPYGFVAPDARVWFQKFVDTDEFGEETEHEYMMTNGYLWTGQFPEAQSAIDEGKGQSMELQSETLEGHWANDAKTGMDFFIINDAVFSKLCILGDDVEPCFEGASVTGRVGNDFAQGAEFSQTLFSMMQQLKDIVEAKEGGKNMPIKPQEPSEEAEVVTDFVASNAEQPKVEAPELKVEEDDSPSIEQESTVEEFAEDTSDDAVDDTASDESEADAEDATTASEVEANGDGEVNEEVAADETPDEPAEDDAKDEDAADDAHATKRKKNTRFSLLEEENEELRAELEALRKFKLEVENREKDALIEKYHMLSDEDKADVIAHKEEYSLEQIDEKLALVYVRKNVDFSTVDGHKEEDRVEDSILSFSLDDKKDAEVVSDIQAAFRSLEN